MNNLSNIIPNEKYTLLIENSFGFVVARQVKITKVFTSSYAQYNETLVIHYIAKGKRKATGARFIDNKIAVIEGWHDIKGTFQDENINTFESFQDGNFETVLKNSGLNPVYNYKSEFEYC